MSSAANCSCKCSSKQTNQNAIQFWRWVMARVRGSWTAWTATPINTCQVPHTSAVYSAASWVFRFFSVFIPVAMGEREWIDILKILLYSHWYGQVCIPGYRSMFDMHVWQCIDYKSDVLECLLMAAAYMNESCRTFVCIYIYWTIELITIYWL